MDDLDFTAAADATLGTIDEPLPTEPTTGVDITKMPQGYVGVADPKLSNYVNAFTLFALAVTFQLRKADAAEGDEFKAHDPKFILPGTYRTLIDNAKQLKAMVPHVKSASDVSRIRGKALQFLYFERNMPVLLDENGEAIIGDDGKPRKEAFIAKFIKRENQGKYMKALRYAVRELVTACDTNMRKDVEGITTSAQAPAAPAAA